MLVGPISERDLRHLAIAYCKENGIKITNRGSVISMFVVHTVFLFSCYMIGAGGPSRSATVDINSILGVLNALGIVEEILPSSSRYPKEVKESPKSTSLFNSLDNPPLEENQSSVSSLPTSAPTASDTTTSTSTAVSSLTDPLIAPDAIPRSVTPNIPISLPAEALITPTSSKVEDEPLPPAKPTTSEDTTPMDIAPTALRIDMPCDPSPKAENDPSSENSPRPAASTPSDITSSLSSANLTMHPFLSYIVDYWASAASRKKDGASTPTTQSSLPETPTSLPDTPKPSKRPRLWQLLPTFTPFPIAAWGVACSAAQSAAHDEESLLRRILGSCSKSLPSPTATEPLVPPPVMDGTSNFTAAMIMDRAGHRKYKRTDKLVKKKKHLGLGDVTYIRHAVPPLVVDETSPTIVTAPIDWSDVAKEFAVYHPPENDVPPLSRSVSAESVTSAQVLNMAATPKNLNGAVGTWVTVAEEKEDIRHDVPERRRSISEGKMNGDSGRHREFRRISFADVIAPSFRLIETAAHQDDSAGEEDLSDEAFAARHDAVLSKMRERWSKLLNRDEDGNHEHGRRGHWKKHHGGRLPKKRRSDAPSVQTLTSSPMLQQQNTVSSE